MPTPPDLPSISRQRAHRHILLIVAVALLIVVGLGVVLRFTWQRPSADGASAANVVSSAPNSTTASRDVPAQAAYRATAASSPPSEVEGTPTAGGPVLLEDDAATLDTLLQGMPADAEARGRETVRISHCTTTHGHRWRTPAGARPALLVVTIDCRPPELGATGDENERRRAFRLSEYPLVFVARDGRFSEVELPGFMYESGQIGSVQATADGWPVFHLSGTVYECGEEDKDCQSDGDLDVVFRDGEVAEWHPPGATAPASR